MPIQKLKCKPVGDGSNLSLVLSPMLLCTCAEDNAGLIDWTFDCKHLLTSLPGLWSWHGKSARHTVVVERNTCLCACLCTCLCTCRHTCLQRIHWRFSGSQIVEFGVSKIGRTCTSACSSTGTLASWLIISCRPMLTNTCAYGRTPMPLAIFLIVDDQSPLAVAIYRSIFHFLLQVAFCAHDSPKLDGKAEFPKGGSVREKSARYLSTFAIAVPEVGAFGGSGPSRRKTASA